MEYADPRIQQSHATCTVQGPPSLIATGDPLLLGQAVLNLLLNAADACRAAGTSSSDTQPATRPMARSQFVVSVTDNGAGIDPQILDRIFNPFFTTRDSGTGLGLSIVHRIVEAHEGTIMAANVEGGGARFELRV